MNQHLQTTIAAIQKLSDKEQERIASLLDLELVWEQDLEDPSFDAAIAVLEEQALKEIEAGQVYDKPGRKR